MRDKCRFCGNERKKGVLWYDDDYCSGKCKKQDGGTIPPAAKPDKTNRAPASFEDYMLYYPKKLGEKDSRGQRIKGREPKLYRRRSEPEKLNWGEPMSEEELKQAGLRCNRQPIPGDWDFVEKNICATEVQAIAENFKVQTGENIAEVAEEKEDAPLNEWQALKAKAKLLGIQTYGKKREQIEAEIMEKENA